MPLECCQKQHRCPKCGWTGRGIETCLEYVPNGTEENIVHICPVCKTDDAQTEIVESFEKKE